jgi:ribosomal protein L11 methyltransferase
LATEGPDVEPDSWLALRCRISEASKEHLSAFLFELGSRGLTEEHPGLDLGDDGPLLSGDPGEWRPDAPKSPDGYVQLTAWFRGGEDVDRLVAATSARLTELSAPSNEVSVERVAPADWNAAWKRHFEPFQVSPRLWIVPTWHEAPAVRGNERVIRMDPGMAFGTGTHFTTAGCLRMLDHLLANGVVIPSLLDVGTGTGVLAIGALLLGAQTAVGLDTSADAVAATIENAALNGVASRMQAHHGPLESLPRGTFPVIVANLLAPLLVHLADQLADRLSSGGLLIVSGLLRSQEEQVRAALGAVGLRQTDAITDDDWAVLRFER